jgi:hypothetical protein
LRYACSKRRCRKLASSVIYGAAAIMKSPRSVDGDKSVKGSKTPGNVKWYL